ncbi:MAG: alanine--tRNA ligase [Limisphaerales bacterium]
MTSVEIRKSFLDFFKSKGHTIVPSSSLMPDSPGLLFTNAGMNQFVPIFLNQRAADVDKWPGAIPGKPTRATDTQKCIRAGGKHNDLEDVGLDTYHHTFFEMLGNWSFGDYFKKEAIEWAWELVTEVWKFPKNRLYATVYNPDKAHGDPSEFDREAHDFWAARFTAAGLDPKVHVISGNKKDNFWMMGETGPCGPCSEIHVDLTPAGDTKGSLVNKGDARCIEIWNLVFIQFNANPDGTFSPLPARHVDTGMGFERVTGIMQNTKNFTDFTRTISNYETDIFRPIFDKIEKLSGKHYKSTLPKSGTAGETDQQKIDIAFRVIADHIRTLSFSIADGILPGNNDRNYVLRRILRRAVRYGRTLGFHDPFFYKLVDVLADTMGGIFPEIRAKRDHVKDVISTEEEAFNKTLDLGIRNFEQVLLQEEKFVRFIEEKAAAWGKLKGKLERIPDAHKPAVQSLGNFEDDFASLAGDFGTASFDPILSEVMLLMRGILSVHNRIEPLRDVNDASEFHKDYEDLLRRANELDDEFNYVIHHKNQIRKHAAFVLYDTYGFPLDLTELMARERGLKVDTAGFEKLMDEQRARARAAQKKEIIAASNIDTSHPTRFVGFDQLTAAATILGTVNVKNKIAVTFDASPLYAEMGGQVGDTGEIQAAGKVWHIVNTQKTGNTWLHFLADKDAPEPGTTVELRVEAPRRDAIQRHHSVTHLLHWALHEVVSADATQKGSYVGPDKLTFDFSSAALDPEQVADVERLVNERILENAGVTWTEVPYAEVKGRKDIMQFFGEKYGDMVRVVQIGGKSGGLDGYSMELCGGTHTRATGEVGLFRIMSESAVAAGIRRIEAVAGLRAYDKTREDAALISSVAGKVNSPIGELEKRVESLLAQQKDLEKQLKAVQQKQAAELARTLTAKAQTLGSTPAIIENLGAVDGDFLQSVADALKGQLKGVVVLGGSANNAVSLVATVSSDFTKKLPAGRILQTIAPLVGGRGGGKPDNARGGGKDVSKLDEALKKAGEMLKNI